MTNTHHTLDYRVVTSNTGTIHKGYGPQQTGCGNIKNKPTTKEYVSQCKDYIFCEKCFPTSAAIAKARGQSC